MESTAYEISPSQPNDLGTVLVSIRLIGVNASFCFGTSEIGIRGILGTYAVASPNNSFFSFPLLPSPYLFPGSTDKSFVYLEDTRKGLT